MTRTPVLARVAQGMLAPDYLRHLDDDTRRRCQEALALGALTQYLLVGWVLAALAWAGDGPLRSGGAVLAVMFSLPHLVTAAYLYRHRALVAARWTRRRVVEVAFVVVALVVAAAGFAHHHGGVSALLDAPGWIGGICGGAGALLLSRRLRRYQPPPPPAPCSAARCPDPTLQETS